MTAERFLATGGRDVSAAAHSIHPVSARPGPELSSDAQSARLKARVFGADGCPGRPPLIEFQPLPPRRRRCAAALSVCIGLLIAWTAGCGESRPPPPDASWPAGALLSARTDALDSLLAQLERLQGTPLARHAGRLREALPDCTEVEAIAEGPEGLIAGLRCVGSPPALPGLRSHRGGAVASLALPIREDAPRLLLVAHTAAGGLQLDLRWPDPEPPLGALLPGAEPSGPDVLSAGERLFHVRVRVDGPLDLAGLVPAGSQGDDLFRLRSELLGAAILDGTWEAALYAPERGSDSPRVAIALGVRLQSAAAAAADRLIGDVEAHWSVSRTPLPPGGDPGACLLGLRLLPDLAPCYQATERALVLAWNPASLRHALEPGTSRSTNADPGRIELDLARLREVDLHLASRIGPEAVSAVASWPWRRLTARGGRRDDALTLRVELEAEGRGGWAR